MSIENVSRDNCVGSIVTEESIKRELLPPGIQKNEGLINTSIELFRQILTDDDQRWHIVNAWYEVVKEPNIRGIYREVALGTKYLSETPSRRNEYGKYTRSENLRQLCRATNNLRANDKLQLAFDSLEKPLFPNTLHFARTNKITLGTGSDGVTGCPEALYQIRLFSDGKKPIYLGRLGFNMHHEQQSWVMSITNLQGIPGGCPSYEEFRRNGIEPFNVIVRFAKELAFAFDESTEVRALRNPSTQYAGFINTVCKKEEIQRYYYHKY